MTKRTWTITLVLGLTIGLLALPASAARETQKVRGQVTAMGEAAPGPNGTTMRTIQLRTKDGEMLQLHLRERESCANCLRVGDQIRARVHTQNPQGSALRVQSMKVNRDGQSLRYQDGSAGWRGGSQGQPGAGQGTGQRDRLHAPDTSGGPGPQHGASAPAQGNGGRGSGGASRGRG